MKKYILEIYAPNNTDDVVGYFESSTPFCSLQKGELLNPAFYNSYTDNPGTIMKIINVEHIIWQHEGQPEPTQKLCVFTTAVQNTAEVRISL